MEDDEEYAYQLQLRETLRASMDQGGAAATSSVPLTRRRVDVDRPSIRVAEPAPAKVSRRAGKGEAEEDRKGAAKKDRKGVAEEDRKGVGEEDREGVAEEDRKGVAEKASSSESGRRRSGRLKEKRDRELEVPGNESEVGQTELKSRSKGKKSRERGREAVAEPPVPARRTCAICMQLRPDSSFRSSRGCEHTFCVDCVSQHVEVRVRDGQGPVSCPEPACAGVIGSLECLSLTCSKATVENLEKLEVLSCIPEVERFYCPFRECSAMMCQPGTSSSSSHRSRGHGGSRITSVECFSCHRLFCADCKVPWHADLTCKQFQQSLKEKNAESDAADVEFQKLVAAKKWRKCPNCKFMIELREGCIHMTCRCGHQFCYLCGRRWRSEGCDCAAHAPMRIPPLWRP